MFDFFVANALTNVNMFNVIVICYPSKERIKKIKGSLKLRHLSLICLVR